MRRIQTWLAAVSLFGLALGAPLDSSLARLGSAAVQTPTPTPLISGHGGIGNTREDVISYWDIDTTDDPAFPPSIIDHIELVMYDLPNYQNTFVFQVKGDDVSRPQDQLISLNVGFISSVEPATADDLVNDFLPEDAEPQGAETTNRFGERVQLYQSDSIADAFPSIDIEGFDEPGTVWVTYFHLGDRVGVVDVSLYDVHEA